MAMRVIKMVAEYGSLYLKAWIGLMQIQEHYEEGYRLNFENEQ